MPAAAELCGAGNSEREPSQDRWWGAPGFQARGPGLLRQSPQLFAANPGGPAAKEAGGRHGVRPGVPRTAAPLGGQGRVWPRQEGTRQATCATVGNVLECPLVTTVAFGTTDRWGRTQTHLPSSRLRTAGEGHVNQTPRRPSRTSPRRDWDQLLTQHSRLLHRPALPMSWGSLGKPWASPWPINNTTPRDPRIGRDFKSKLW